MKIQISHRCSIPGSWWVTPIGWRPANEFDAASYEAGSWRDNEDEEGEEVAGLIYFGNGHEEEIIEADIDDIRVASCGNCRVIAKVNIAE